MSVAPCRPLSRGSITLRSIDPGAPPRIEPNYLAEPADLEELVVGFEFLRRLARMPALANVIAEEITPGEHIRTREDIIEYARANASTVFHPCSTCRMGPNDDRNVVDHRLKVHGVDGLRIVDASIFPNVTSGNTNAPVVMVAEKGADLILGSQ